ncbi:hypothetical protein N9L71_12935, partial [Verrucomicrobiales bacterium]|nr:hypothetical protein [Verrucomicrobiales bacterium]
MKDRPATESLERMTRFWLEAEAVVRTLVVALANSFPRPNLQTSILMFRSHKPSAIFLCLVSTALAGSFLQSAELPQSLNAVIEAHCVECHDDIEAKGGL